MLRQRAAAGRPERQSMARKYQSCARDAACAAGAAAVACRIVSHLASAANNLPRPASLYLCTHLPPAITLTTTTTLTHTHTTIRSYLFSSDRILDALGSSLISHSEALIPLCTTLDEVCVSAGVGHGRLLLLQAAASLFVGLAQQPKARQALLQPQEAQRVISSCLQVRKVCRV